MAFSQGNRFKRHIGVPDHGGIQRLIATGGLAKALNAKTDRFGYSDSIDVVFPVYWMFPAKTRLLTAEDIKCVESYRKLIREGKEHHTAVKQISFKLVPPTSPFLYCCYYYHHHDTPSVVT